GVPTGPVRQREREGDARRLAGVAESLRESDPTTAMRLNLAAWKLADLPETRSGLLTAAHQRQQDVFPAPDTEPGAIHRLSSDGATLLTVGAGQSHSWDVVTRTKKASMPGLGTRLKQAGSPSDAFLVPVIGDDDGETTVWDLQTGRHDDRALGTFDQGVKFTANGTLLLGYSTKGSRYRIQLWDVATRQLVWQKYLSRDGKAARRAALAPWQLGTNPSDATLNRRFMGDGLVPDATVSPDGRLLALCIPGKALQLWDLQTGKQQPVSPAPVMTLEICRGAWVGFSPDSRTLAVPMPDRVRMWDTSSRKERASILRRGIQQVAFSRDGAFVATADGGGIRLWRTAQPRFALQWHPLLGERITDLRLDTDAGLIRYLVDPETPSMAVRTLYLGAIADTRWQQAATWQADFSTGATALARATEAGTGKIQVETWSPLSGQRDSAAPATPCPRDTLVSCFSLLSIDSAGQKLAYGTTGETGGSARIFLWDISGRRVTDTLAFSEVDGIGFAGEASSLVLMGRDTAARLWDPARRTVVKTLPPAYGNFFARHPRRPLLSTSGGQALDVRSGTNDAQARDTGRASALSYSPEGRYLAVGKDSGRTILWSGDRTTQLGELVSPAMTPDDSAYRGVQALAFSPDSRVLAVGSAAGTVQLWDTASRQPIGAPLLTPGDIVLALAFAADGRTLYLSGRYVPLQAYALAPAATASAICRRVTTGLSEQEWRTYLPTHKFQPTCR
ncbi:WD40 repeat domain-containing protein, partial [Nonomuraea sp. NPDC059022]|uniref:WD40 repeat domain-containing protein n=1 Tax=Nonomuraea sp. NPDC059022 TaxID=3346705 RepID=UPI00368B3ECB